MSRGGRRWRTVRAAFRARCARENTPCWLCGQTISYDLPSGHPECWEPDHFHPVATHPHLELDPANLRASHLTCNRNRGDRAPTVLGIVSRRW